MVGYNFPLTKDDVTASTTMRVSTKACEKICRKLNRKNFAQAKAFCAGLIDQTKSIDGKFHTKSAEHILLFLNSLENNAVHRNISADERKLFISAHQGPKYMRARRKRMFGHFMKVTHVSAVLRMVKAVEKNKIISKKEIRENEPRRRALPSLGS